MNCKYDTRPYGRSGLLKAALFGAAFALLCGASTVNAQTIWNTGSLSFTNTAGVGQDVISAQTTLTRGATGPIYNSVCQAFPGAAGCPGYLGPCNTEWALGSIANWNTLTYQPLYAANACNPPSMVTQTWVCHLITENIYFQVQWVSYNAGAFSYNRTTGPATVSTNSGSGLAPAYLDLAAAITALNAATITSPVVITVNPSSPQTAPAGGYAITATGTPANTISIQGGGNTVTASGAQVVGSINDAIFKIIGGDYITINNFVMQENAANVVNTPSGSNNMTEFGVALFYASTTNGAQNVTISNNTISLNRTYTNTFGIYANSRHSATAMTTTAENTTPAGAHSNLRIYSNNISNVNQGIVSIGPLVVANMPTGLDIGGAGLPTGNTITNFGTAAGLSGYISVSLTCNGVLINNQLSANVSYNSITSSTGMTASTALRGIYVQNTGTQPTTAYSNTYNNNSISLQHSIAAGTLTGIADEQGTTSSIASISISNNNFHDFGHTVAGTGAVIFITNTGPELVTNVNGNTFTNISMNTTGSVTFLGPSLTRPTGSTVNVNNNAVVGTFTKTGAGGTITIYDSFGTTPQAGSSETNNGNNFSNMTFTGAVTLNGWRCADGSGSAPFGGTKTVMNNTFSNINLGTGSAGYVLYVGYGNSTATNTVTGNTISNITGGGAILGLTSPTSSQNIVGNTITGLATTGASSNVTGLSITGATAQNVMRNKICDLQAGGATGTVNGILVSSGTTINVVNNLIGDLRAPNSSGTNQVIGINLTGGTTRNVAFNTVVLSATSVGANFGTSAISASTGTSLNMGNNILVNNSTPVGTGFTVAYRRSSTTLTSYTSGDNNLFYAGVPGPANFIFHDGTNALQSLTADYKPFVAPRDANSVTENPVFLSTTCSSPDFLHFPASAVTLAESGGVNVVGVTDDYDGQTRQGNPGYAGSGSAPDIGADEFAGVNPNACTGAPTAGTISGTSPICAGPGTTLSLSGASTGIGITYQWKTGPSGGPYTTNLGTAATQATGALTAGTYYYVCDVTCTSPGGSTVTTPEFTLVVNPTPTASASSNTPVCVGGQLNLTGTTNIGTTFNWNGPNGFNSASQNPSIPGVTAAAAGTYTFTATLGSCASAPATTAVVIGTVTPTMNFVTATPPTICPSSNSNLLASASVALPPPTYCAAGATNTGFEKIGNVTTAGINQTSSATAGYENFTAVTGNITAGGGPIPVSVLVTGSYADGVGGDDRVRIWIDTDQDGVFADPGERFYDVAVSSVCPTCSGTNATVTGTMTVPSTAANGSTRMRVRMWDNLNSPAAGIPCGNSTYGQVEDYTVVITGGAPPPFPGTYSWSPTTFLNNPGIANPVAQSVTSTTTYTATATYIGCTATGTATVTVGTPSPPTVTISAGGPTAICPGGSVTLSANITGGCAPFTYAWSNGVTTVGTNPTYDAMAAGSYSLTVMDNGGLTATSNTIAVTANPAPTASAASNSPVCVGGTLNLTGTTDIGTTFNWNGPNGFNSGSQNPSIVGVTAAAAGTYTFTATANGCTSTPATTAVVISTVIPVMGAVTATPPAVCNGSNSQLNASASVSTPGSITVTISGTGFLDEVGWTLTNSLNQVIGSGGPYGSSPNVHPLGVQPNGPFVFFLETQGTFNDNVANYTIQCNASTILSGTLNGGLTFTSGSLGCSSSTPVTTFTWAPPTFLSNPNIANPVAQAMTGTTTYTATANFNGCSSTGTVTVTVNPLPVVTCGGPYGPFCSADPSIPLSGTPVGGTWSGPGVAGNNFNPTTAGGGSHTVTYSYTDLNGCTNLCTTQINVTAATAWYLDQDGDGFGDPANSVMACAQPPGYVAVSGDLCPFDPTKQAPGQCGCGVPDIDTDGDGTANCVDGCPNDPNKVAPGICGCGNPDLDTDGDSVLDCIDGCPLDPNKTAPGQCGCGVPDTDTDGDGTADCNDLCPLDPNKTAPGSCGCGNPDPGSVCDDGDPNTVGDVVQPNCTCAGILFPCATNPVFLTIGTDAKGFETSYDIIPGGGGSPVCTGSGYPNSSSVLEACCLPNGCYSLRVFDSFGDGMCCAYGQGGYILRSASSKRIIDNAGDGGFAFVSQAAADFCVPIGVDELVASSCDRENLILSSVIQAKENNIVTANFSLSNGITGYQFWIFDPDGGYSRRIFQSHQTPGGAFPPGTPNGLKCSYLALNSIVTNPVPSFTLLNVRVRSRVTGVYAEFGPACRMKIDPTAGCATTQLTTTLDPVISCGATNVPLDGSLASNMYATTVPGANKYQFEFSRPGYLRKIASPTRGMTLVVWYTNPLQCGQTYDVRVRVSFDGGATYCPFGPACTLSIAPCAAPLADPRVDEDATAANVATLLIYPNPNRGEQLFVNLSGLPEEEMMVSVDIHDLFGKRVLSTAVPAAGMLNTTLELNHGLASGIYLVNVTVGEQVFTQRLVIQ